MSENPDALYISWETIVNEFGSRYDAVFEYASAKVHLDVTNQIIDGAKGKWKYIMLMDCLLCFAMGSDRSVKECGRRRFNQYVALRESVCLAVSTSWILHLQAYSDTESSIESAQFPSSVNLTNIEYPWSTCALLHDFLTRNAPKKSYQKRLEILNIYFSNHIFETMTLNEVIVKTIQRIYCQHFCLGQNANTHNISRSVTTGSYDMYEGEPIQTAVHTTEANQLDTSVGVLIANADQYTVPNDYRVFGRQIGAMHSEESI